MTMLEKLELLDVLERKNAEAEAEYIRKCKAETQRKRKAKEAKAVVHNR